MALVQCRGCGNHISQQMTRCRHCGAPQTEALLGAHPLRAAHPIAWLVTAAIMYIVGTLLCNYASHVRLPAMPINVQSRPAAAGSGRVLMFQNTSDRPVPLLVRLEHLASKEHKRFDLYVAARTTVELDNGIEWTGQSGDRITLENSNFQPWRGSIP